MQEILEKSREDLKNNSTKDTWGGVATVSCNVLKATEEELINLRLIVSGNKQKVIDSFFEYLDGLTKKEYDANSLTGHSVNYLNLNK